MTVVPAVAMEDDKDKGIIESSSPLYGSKDEPHSNDDCDDVEQARPSSCEEEFALPEIIDATKDEIAVTVVEQAVDVDIAVVATNEAADVECAEQAKVEPAPEAAPPIQQHNDIENDASTRTTCCSTVPWFCSWCLDVKASSLPSPPHMPHTLQNGVLPLDEWNAFWNDVYIFDRRKRRCDVISFFAGIGTFVGLLLGLVEGGSALWVYAMLVAALLILLFPVFYERRRDELFHSLCKEHQDRVFGTRGLSLTVVITRKITQKNKRKEEKITTIISISQPAMGEDGTPTSTTFAYRSTIDSCCSINQWHCQ